jgi:hypothetical protein
VSESGPEIDEHRTGRYRAARRDARWGEWTGLAGPGGRERPLRITQKSPRHILTVYGLGYKLVP